jgi:deoxycytidylate deaminase
MTNMISKRILNYLCLLQNYATNSTMIHRHAAMLFRNKETHMGYNNDRSYLNNKLVPSIHAEMDVMHRSRAIIKDMSKYSLFVIRINKSGKICNSKPCCKCIESLQARNVKNIYYSDSNGNIICEKTKDITNDHSSSIYKMCSQHLKTI